VEGDFFGENAENGAWETPEIKVDRLGESGAECNYGFAQLQSSDVLRQSPAESRV
jgi:hypothetical protein